MVVLLVISASALWAFATAAPVQDRILSQWLEARQAPSCNIGTQVGNANAYDSSCWDTLNIGPYLTNWKAATPTCTDAESSAGQTLKCCGASEPWSTCFLRLATKQVNAYDCTQLAPSGSGPTCSLDANGGRAFELDSGLDPSIASQVNYVVLNIIMINNFFASYFTTLKIVASNEGQTLNSLISQSTSTNLDLSNVGVDLQNVMAALTLGLAFPEVAPPQLTSFNDGTTVTNEIPTKRDPQTPDPSTSSNSAPESSLSVVGECDHSWMTTYWQDGRHHRRQQPDTCGDGTHSEENTAAPGSSLLPLGPRSPPVIMFNQALQQSPNVAAAMWPSAINPTTDTIANLASAHLSNSDGFAPILTAGLQLLMSDVGAFTAFAGNGLFSTPIPSTSEPSASTVGYTGALDTFILSQILESNSISATPGSLTSANPCASGIICDSSYWSPITKRQYSFKGSNAYAMINKAMTSTRVDLPMLFDGAYNCTFAGQAGGSVVSLKPDNSLNMACLSVLPMYLDGDCPDGATWVGGKCPFGHN